MLNSRTSFFHHTPPLSPRAPSTARGHHLLPRRRAGHLPPRHRTSHLPPRGRPPPPRSRPPPPTAPSGHHLQSPATATPAHRNHLPAADPGWQPPQRASPWWIWALRLHRPPHPATTSPQGSFNHPIRPLVRLQPPDPASTSPRRGFQQLIRLLTPRDLVSLVAPLPSPPSSDPRPDLPPIRVSRRPFPFPPPPRPFPGRVVAGTAYGPTSRASRDGVNCSSAGPPLQFGWVPSDDFLCLSASNDAPSWS